MARKTPSRETLASLLRALQARADVLGVRAHPNVSADRAYPPPAGPYSTLMVCLSSGRHKLVWNECIDGVSVLSSCTVPDEHLSEWDDGLHQSSCPRFSAGVAAAKAIADGLGRLQ